MRRIRFGDHCGYVNAELPAGATSGPTTFSGDCPRSPSVAIPPIRETPASRSWPACCGTSGPSASAGPSLGLEIVHLTQTNLAFKDGEFGPAGIPNFPKINFMCPDFNGVNPKFPEGRAALRASRRWFFDHLPCIEQVNYYLTSGWDGGGCNDPAVAPWILHYADLVDTIVYPALAKHNPK